MERSDERYSSFCAVWLTGGIGPDKLFGLRCFRLRENRNIKTVNSFRRFLKKESTYCDETFTVDFYDIFLET